MKFAIFGLRASVDIMPLPGAWVAELLGVVLGVQDRLKVKFPITNIYKYDTWRINGFILLIGNHFELL